MIKNTSQIDRMMEDANNLTHSELLDATQQQIDENNNLSVMTPQLDNQAIYEDNDISVYDPSNSA